MVQPILPRRGVSRQRPEGVENTDLPSRGDIERWRRMVEARRLELFGAFPMRTLSPTPVPAAGIRELSEVYDASLAPRPRNFP